MLVMRPDGPKCTRLAESMKRSSSLRPCPKNQSVPLVMCKSHVHSNFKEPQIRRGITLRCDLAGLGLGAPFKKFPRDF